MTRSAGETSIRARRPTLTRTCAEPERPDSFAKTAHVPASCGVYRPNASIAPPVACQVGVIGTTFPRASVPVAVYRWASSAVIVAVGGETVIATSAPGRTVTEVVPTTPLWFAYTVHTPIWL